jgi:murein L,D-transpeptidase YcbB/YkuD
MIAATNSEKILSTSTRNKVNSAVDSSLNLFQALWLAFQIWQQYGATFKNLLDVLNDLKSLDNGTLFAKIEAIFLAHGFNLAMMFSGITGVGDFTNIKTIQGALNSSGGTMNQIAITGVLDNPTILAVQDFQKFKGLVVDGIPGTLTLAALAATVGS